MTIREARKTDAGPKIVFLFDGSWTRRKPHERGVDVDGEERRNMRQAAGGRAGARFSSPPEQPLAPEVASAGSGHLGHLGHAPGLYVVNLGRFLRSSWSRTCQYMDI